MQPAGGVHDQHVEIAGLGRLAGVVGDRRRVGTLAVSDDLDPVPVLIGGSQYVPPQPYLVPVQMDKLFRWYETETDELHPVVLAAELHERIVTIHPFIDGNGRTARLIMNLTLFTARVSTSHSERRYR